MEDLSESIENTMDKIVKHIFVSCDKDNTDSVQVSVLVNFVKPYMPGNELELQTLQAQLDPNNINPCVSGAFFYKAMIEWVDKLKNDTNMFSDCNNSENVLHVHSTPTTMRSYSEFVKSCSKILNSASSSSVYEYGGSCNSSLNEREAYQDRIDEIESNNQRLINDLQVANQQLAVAEEDNEHMAGKIKQLTKSLQAEQQTTKQLRKNLVEFEETKEKLFEKTNMIKNFEKLVKSLEKEKAKLDEKLTKYEDSNFELNTKLELVRRSEQNFQRQVLEFKNMMDIKQSDYEDLTMKCNKLSLDIQVKTEIIQDYKNENDLLKQQLAATKKEHIENCARIEETAMKHSRHLHEIDNTFNSPQLLRQLANPISPNFGISSCLTSTPKNNINEEASVDENNTNYYSTSETASQIYQKTLLEELLEVAEPNKQQIEQMINQYDLLLEERKINENEIQRLNNLLKESKKNERIIEKGTEIVSNLCKTLDQYSLQLQLDDKTQNNETFIEQLQELGLLIENLINKKNLTPNAMLNNGCLSERQQMKINFNQEQLEDEVRKLKEENECIKEKATFEINYYITKLENFRIESEKTVESLNLQINKLQCEIVHEEGEMERYRSLLSGNENAYQCKIEHYHQVINKHLNEKMQMHHNYQIELNNLKKENSELDAKLHSIQSVLIDRQHQYELLTQAYKQFETYSNNLQSQKNEIELVCKRKEEENDYFIKCFNNFKDKLEIISNDLASSNLTIIEYVENCETNNVDEINEFKCGLQQIANIECDNFCEKEFAKLSNYAKMLMHLVNAIVERKFELFDRSAFSFNQELQSSTNLETIKEEDDEFQSCLNNLSCQWLEDFKNQITETDELDSLFETFTLHEDDARHAMSKSDMEKKFTSFALSSTFNSATAKNRLLKEQQLYCNQIGYYLDYLNGTVNLLTLYKNDSQKQSLDAALDNLNKLKDITNDIIKTSQKCGVYYYESRANILWNFVVNYVALLSKENKELILKNTRKVNSNASRSSKKKSSFWSMLLNLSLVIAFVIIFFIVLIILYVQGKCMSESKFVCPLDWILDSVVEKTTYYPPI